MSENNNKRLKVGITIGDTNGIGAEVVMKAVSEPEMLGLCVPIIYGSGKIISYHRNACNLPGFQINHTKTPENIKENMPNLVECIEQEIKVELGHPSKQAGTAAFMALEAAVRDLKTGLIDVLVTAPISKDNIQSDQFHFPGHTEYLESAAGEDNKALMILCTAGLRVALVTGHLPLSQVPAALTIEGIREKLRLFNDSLKRDFNIDGPRIAVLSSATSSCPPSSSRLTKKAFRVLVHMPLTVSSVLAIIAVSTVCLRCITTKAWRPSKPLPWTKV